MSRILVVDDEAEVLRTVKSLLEAEGQKIDTYSDPILAMNILQKERYDLILLDLNMPKMSGIELLESVKERYPLTEVIMLTGVIEVRTAVECMSRGAFYYLNKPFMPDEIQQTVRRALERRRLSLENRLMRTQLSRLSPETTIIGKSEAFQKVLDLAGRVAQSDTSVLLLGESGTGKEVIANYIYLHGVRSSMPFVALNCSSIPDTLIESELFGHEKGAFTDAQSRKQGLVEIADGGTLFLDEIGDISPVFQPKLLRFIQTGEFRRVGGNVLLKSDVRIISSTNKNLQEEVRSGRFREDLFYRLNVISLILPSLRERKEDIPDLIEYFLSRKLRPGVEKKFDKEALELLTQYDWPGNVRELENVIEGAIVLSKGKEVMPTDLPLPMVSHTHRHKTSGSVMAGSSLSLKEFEKLHIQGVLDSVSWDKGKAATILGISLKTLYNKIAQYQFRNS
ncbi:MAG: sigma-54-dependent Fis family transcriptional regulator [Ignavibacteriae bacterium]|nr:sigma-54-dependent Fis family transcriptional regulator [Ignavibacteriota bacterium]